MHRLTTIICGLIIFFNVQSQFDNAQLKLLLEKHAITGQESAMHIQQVDSLIKVKQQEVDDLQVHKKRLYGFIGIRAAALAMGGLCLWASWHHADDRAVLLIINTPFAVRIAQGAYYLRKTHIDFAQASADLKDITCLQHILIKKSQQTMQ